MTLAPDSPSAAFDDLDGTIAVLREHAAARCASSTPRSFVGYDGGRVASESLADHAIVTRSQNIPRIQEAQASVYHALSEPIEDDG